MNAEVLQNIARKIDEQTLSKYPDNAWQDAKYIEKLTDAGWVNNGIVDIESAIATFIGLRNTKQFRYLNPEDQQLLQNFTIITINSLAGSEYLLTTPPVSQIEDIRNLLEHRPQISPSSVWAAEHIATKVAIRIMHNPSSTPK